MNENDYNGNTDVNEQTEENDVNKQAGLEPKNSYHFNPNERDSSNYDEGGMNKEEENEYNSGRQVNRAKGLVKSLSSVSSFPNRTFYGSGSRGVISVLGIGIILGILALIVVFLIK